MTGYHPAQICLNGHVISSYENNVEKFCSQCGSETIITCPSCNVPIRGSYYDDEIVYWEKYKLPAYCFSCGNPYPWTQSNIDAINELVELDDNLSADEKVYINNNISSLIVDTPKTKAVATKFVIFLKKAGKVTASALRDILVDIASETAKKIIFEQ